MTMTIWYGLMLALLWSVFYRSAIVDHRTRISVRLGLFGTAVAALVGIGAPFYGWHPDAVIVVIVTAIVYMQVIFAKFWEYHVPGQYIKPEYKILRRKEDFAQSKFREMA